MSDTELDGVLSCARANSLISPTSSAPSDGIRCQVKKVTTEQDTPMAKINAKFFSLSIAA